MSLASFESSKKSLLNELAELEGANRVCPYPMSRMSLL